MLNDDDLAEMIGKDRSTVYRALQKSISCGLCFRETKNLKKDRFHYVHGAIPWEVFKKRSEEGVQNWHTKLLKIIAEFEQKFGNDFYLERAPKEKTL